MPTAPVVTNLSKLAAASFVPKDAAIATENFR